MNGVFYPEIEAIHFDERTVRGGVSLEASSPFTVLAFYTLPAGVWGILKGFGQGTAVAAGFDNLEWAIRVNGAPLYGLGSIFDQISSLSRPSLRFQYLASGAEIELLARNLSTTTAYVAFARILGWYYTTPLEDAPISFFGGGGGEGGESEGGVESLIAQQESLTNKIIRSNLLTPSNIMEALRALKGSPEKKEEIKELKRLLILIIDEMVQEKESE